MDLEKRIQAHRKLISDICCPERKVSIDTLEKILRLSMEIAREGREGRKIGTMFVIGDTENTLKHSRSLILDPLFGHPETKKRLDDPNMWETVKELSQLDGAFIVSNDGVVVSACRYINATSEGIHLPLGLGSRHIAAASITRETDAVAVVVSESSMVRIFDNGEMIGEIIPEVWMLRQYTSQLKESAFEESKEEAALISKNQ